MDGEAQTSSIADQVRQIGGPPKNARHVEARQKRRELSRFEKRPIAGSEGKFASIETGMKGSLPVGEIVPKFTRKPDCIDFKR